MTHEIDAVALDSVKAVAGRKPAHTLPIGAPCPNCATPLAGPWCHVCGQSSEDFHRSLIKLTKEALGGLYDVDSRLWRTVPDLCLRPARLTRAFLDGHRITQVPPFRLFLVVVVLVFLAAGSGGHVSPKFVTPSGETLTPQTRVSVDESHSALAKWMISRAVAVSKNPERFGDAMFTWAQRLVFLALPLSALLLGAMFFWREGVYLFDHLIFSMHSLSFQGMLLSIALLAMNLSDAFGVLFLIAPVHLFAHLKGTYGLGVFGTLLRMTVLFVVSFVAFVFASTALVLIGLFEVAP
jgi:hypothetical protein